MRRPGIKRRKKKVWYDPHYDDCIGRYCNKCYNRYCRVRKPKEEFKGYNPPKPKETVSVEKEQSSAITTLASFTAIYTIFIILSYLFLLLGRIFGYTEWIPDKIKFAFWLVSTLLEILFIGIIVTFTKVKE